jgi:hypothetical protein
MIKFKNQQEGFPAFLKSKYEEFICRFEEDWLSSLSLCKPLYINEEKLGLFEKIQFKFKFSDLEEKSGIQTLKSNGYEMILQEIKIPHGLLFPIYKFDLKQFIQEERKFVLIIKEVQLLNLIGSIVNGLSLCRSMKLPHGNLSLTTIFKKGKYDWEISPPLYSRINLLNRRTKESDYVNIAVGGEFAIDYLIAPELYTFFDKKAKCKTFNVLIPSGGGNKNDEG